MKWRIDARVLAQTASSRLAVLQQPARAAEAAHRERAWADGCSAYVAARSAPPAPADIVQADGLTWHVPVEAEASPLGSRLRAGLLPWHDVACQRIVGVGTSMIDVGANVGTTSICRVVAGDVQYAYAIEPEPANYSCLVHNLVANRLNGYVLPDACAIADEDGDATLRVAALGTHALASRDAPPKAARSVRVPVRRLDTWIAERRIEPALIAFVKVDAQGAEARVLLGAPRLASQAHIAWIIEVSPKHLGQAGTTVAELIALIERHFSHAIDLRGDGVARLTRELGSRLAYIGEGQAASYTNLALYHGEEALPASRAPAESV
jgi:FkbM family methyltransferase